MGFFDSVLNFAGEAYANYAANKDKGDVLKSLVFITSYKATVNRELKKIIVQIMQLIDEEFSLYRDEPEIDSIYRTLQSRNSEEIFEDILSFRIDRDKIISIFAYDLVLIMLLSQYELLTPQNIYNLYLVKKQLNFSRQELAQCYRIIANLQDADFDDTAEAIEMLTGEEAVNALFEKYPQFVESEDSEEDSLDTDENLISDNVNAPAIEEKNSADPADEIEALIFKAVAESGDSNLSARLIMVKENTKNLQNAIKAYAKEIDGQNVLVQYDDSAFGNGKVGFLLTNENLYFCNSFEKPGVIKLEDVKFMDHKAKSLNSTITVNNFSIDTGMFNGNANTAIYEFLLKAIPLAVQVK